MNTPEDKHLAPTPLPVCYNHSDHCNRIGRNENDIQDLWKHRETDRANTDQSLQRLHNRVDGMKNWVIAGMGSMLLYFGIAILNFLLNWVSSKGG